MIRESKLVELLKCLEKEECKGLQKFVNSDYAKSRNKKTKVLLNTLVKYYPDFGSKALEAKKVFKAVFGPDKFTEKKLRDLMSDLVVQVEAYFVQIQLRESQHLQNRLLAKFYAERNMDKYFYRSAKVSKRAIENESHRDSQYHEKLFFIEDDIYGYISTSKITQGVDGLKEAICSLDAFYIYTRYKYNCELVNRSNIVSEQSELDNTSALEELGRISGLKEKSVFETLGVLYQALNDLKEDNYDAVKAVVLKNIDEFSEAGQFEIWALFTNYCLKLSRANESYVQEVFDLYEAGLDNKYLMPDGKLSDLLFMNIASVGCALGKQAWVQQFINDYKEFLPIKLRENSVRLNQAYTLFSLGEFDESRDVLRDITFENVYYNLVTRCLLLRAYYECQDWAVLEDFLKSFNVFLRRNTLISGKMKEANLKFIQYTGRLIRRNWRSLKDKSLMNDLKEEANVAYKMWLMEKANDLQ